MLLLLLFSPQILAVVLSPKSYGLSKRIDEKQAAATVLDLSQDATELNAISFEQNVEIGIAKVQQAYPTARLYMVHVFPEARFPLKEPPPARERVSLHFHYNNTHQVSINTTRQPWGQWHAAQIGEVDPPVALPWPDVTWSDTTAEMTLADARDIVLFHGYSESLTKKVTIGISNGDPALIPFPQGEAFFLFTIKRGGPRVWVMARDGRVIPQEFASYTPELPPGIEIHTPEPSADGESISSY